MPWVAASIGTAGQFFWTPGGTDAFRTLGFPAGFFGVNMRPSSVIYQNRMYLSGAWTDNAVFTEQFQFWPLGIDPPTVVPSLACGAGASSTVGYLSFYDENTNERSSLSAASAVQAASNTSRTWSSLPTSDNPRVTHIECWVAIDGALPAMSVRRQIGVTSITESVATADLGEIFTDSFQRFPRGKFNTIYHDRLVIAGDDRHPDVLYFSGLFTPERFEGLSLKTRNGEPIVGLVTVRDMLLVLCPRSSYIVQGYTEDDITMQISEPELGTICHAGITVIDGKAFIPTDRGPFVFDGTWHFIGQEIEKHWREQYAANTSRYERAFGIEDKAQNVWKFGPVSDSDVGSSTLTIYWVADYRPVLPNTGGGFTQPNWSYDVRSRTDFSAAELTLSGQRRGDLYTGSCDGFIRQENVDSDGGDDLDGYHKRVTIRTAHYLMNDPGGGRNHGKRLIDCDMYVTSEDSDWSFGIYGGDEYVGLSALSGRNAPFQPTVLSSALTDPGDGATYTKRTVHHFRTKGVAGRGFTWNITASDPVNFTFNGFGGQWRKGPALRPKVDNGGG